TVVPDHETSLPIRLQPSGSLHGRVVWSDGTTAAFGAVVTLVHEKGTVPIQVGEDGTFALAGVPLGTFTLRVSDPVTLGLATVRNQQLVSEQQDLDLGTIVLDDKKPVLQVLEPLDGSSRAKL